MKASTKLGLIGLVASVAIQIGFGLWEIREHRKGKRRMNQKDIDLIATQVVMNQELLKLAKKKTPKDITEKK